MSSFMKEYLDVTMIRTRLKCFGFCKLIEQFLLVTLEKIKSSNKVMQWDTYHIWMIQRLRIMQLKAEL